VGRVLAYLCWRSCSPVAGTTSSRPQEVVGASAATAIRDSSRAGARGIGDRSRGLQTGIGADALGADSRCGPCAIAYDATAIGPETRHGQLVLMLEGRCNPLAARCVPDLRRLVQTCSDDPPAVRAEGGMINHSLMRERWRERLPSSRVPHPCCLVRTCSDNAPTIRTK
jgi:hypothetical protein